MKFNIYALAAVLILGGCVSTLTDDRIRQETAGVLGVSPDDITISNQHQEMTNTYYVARTRSGQEYACRLNGGNIMTFGITNPAVCNKKAQ
jgi:hypothetical protein